MTQNTAQGEAMQAVRLLYRYAVKHQGAEHEALYQARQLLEGVIEGDKTPDDTPFDVGQRVWVLTWVNLSDAYKRWGTVMEIKGSLVKVAFEDEKAPSLMKSWMLHGEWEE